MTDHIPNNEQKHVVIGAGPAGRATATHLKNLDHEVVLISRSGSGPTLHGVERLAVNATDAQALVRAVDGADAMYNCINPTSYARWATEWPPIHAALMHTAKVTGAVLVTLSNLYMYGPQRDASPITPESPENPQDEKGRIRAKMDRETLQAHREGTLRAVVVRASDFLGPRIGDNSHGTRNIPAIAHGRRAMFSGVPINRILGPISKILPQPWLRWPQMTQLMGIASPLIREISSIAYQFKGPWVIDSSEATQALGLRATDWNTVVRRSAEGNVDALPSF